MVFKRCAVPFCDTNNKKDPKKLFIHVPKCPLLRKQWFRLADRDPNSSSMATTIYFCEDHFNLPSDMENYIKYRIMGSVKIIKMKANCLPSKFSCQPDVTKLQVAAVKTQQSLSIKDIDIPSTSRMANEQKLTSEIKEKINSYIETTSAEVTQYNEKQSRKRKFICPHCQKVFRRKSNLDKHTLIHSGAKQFVCPNCCKQFSLKNNLNRHMGIHSEEKLYNCPTCQKGFSQKTHLEEHVRIHSGDKPLVCPTCFKQFRFNGNLNKHLKIHSGLKPYTCPVCQKAFAQKGSLNQHIKHRCRKKLFVCTICSKQLRCQSYFNRHMLTHSGEKPYECPTCHKWFPQKGTFNRHLSTHSGVKSFVCPTCSKQFRYNSELNEHMKVHSKEKLFECHTCQKRFTRKSHLRNHILIHSGKKSFVCPTCFKCFTQKTQRAQHMKIHSKLRTDVDNSSKEYLVNVKKEIDGGLDKNESDFCFEVPVIKEERNSEDELLSYEQILSTSSYPSTGVFIKEEPNENSDFACINQLVCSFIKEESQLSDNDMNPSP